MELTTCYTRLQCLRLGLPGQAKAAGRGPIGTLRTLSCLSLFLFHPSQPNHERQPKKAASRIAPSEPLPTCRTGLPGRGRWPLMPQPPTTPKPRKAAGRTTHQHIAVPSPPVGLGGQRLRLHLPAQEEVGGQLLVQLHRVRVGARHEPGEGGREGRRGRGRQARLEARVRRAAQACQVAIPSRFVVITQKSVGMSQFARGLFLYFWCGHGGEGGARDTTTA